MTKRQAARPLPRISSLRLLPLLSVDPKRNAGEYISAIHYMLFFMPPCECTVPIASAAAVSSPAASRRRHRARTRRHRRQSSCSIAGLRRTTWPCPGHRRRSLTCSCDFSRCSCMPTDGHSPHCRDDALEACVQHRCCKVHNLVRLLLIALGRLAR
jgi:hypothetical protein